MIVYIEQVVIDNLIINYLLLFLTAKILFLTPKFWRMFLGSVTGTVFALVFPLFSLDGILLVLLKILLGMVIINISFEYKTLKKFLLTLFCFVCFTAVMGGLIFGLMFALSPDLKLENGTFVYTHSVPVGIYILVVSVFAKLIYDAFLTAQKKQKLKQFEYDMTICNEKKVVPIKVFLDTGNLLTDKITGKPVIVVSFKTFQKIFNIKTSDYLRGNYNVPNSRYIDLNSALKRMRMLIFEVDSVLIKTPEKEKKIDRAVLGLARADFRLSLGCDAVIGSQVFD